MKLAIVGSRSINNEELIIDFINECYPKLSNVKLVISRGASGVDTIAEKYAKENNIKTKIFYPDWKKYGEQAHSIRNSNIISSCNECIIIWDGYSECTKQDIDLCREMGKKCYIYNLLENSKNIIN